MKTDSCNGPSPSYFDDGNPLVSISRSHRLRAIDEGMIRLPSKVWFEPSCAIIIAIASVATAWCSYESSRWSAKSASLEARAMMLQRLASAQHLEAQQAEGIQLRLVMEVINARLGGNDKLAQFYVDRFRAELKPAYEKWIALNPLENPEAPPHPFVPGLYQRRFEREISEENAEESKAEAEAVLAGSFASSYLSITVGLATVILFAATAEKFDQPRVRRASLFFAIILFLIAAIRTLLLPIA
jgi:hypothetical protein